MKVQPAEKAKLFLGVMFSSDEVYKQIISELVSKFGEIETESDEYDFTDFTKYYEDEMGKNVRKKFVVFRDLIDSSDISDIKLWTNDIEDKYAEDGKRIFNLDPGYFTEAKLVLGTMKNRAHKIYLGKGVYGDLTLLFKKNEAVDFEWTFPDFKSSFVKMFFLKERNKVKKAREIK